MLRSDAEAPGDADGGEELLEPLVFDPREDTSPAKV